jgi:hypothetical protein
MVNRFRHTINTLALQEMPLQGRRFTWSNGQDEPLMARLDSVFFSPTWEDVHPISDLVTLKLQHLRSLSASGLMCFLVPKVIPLQI